MATLTQLRARFREILKLGDVTDVDEGDPPKATITKLINESRQRRYMDLVGSYSKKFLTRVTMTYPAGLESATLPAAAQGRMVSLVKLMPIGGTTGDGWDLQAVGLEQLDLMERSGQAAYYYIDIISKSIWLKPIPAVSTTLHIYHVAALTDLSADADTPSEFPSEFHQLWAYDAVAMYKGESTDPDGEKALEKADVIFDSLKKYVERLSQDTSVRRAARKLF